MTQIGVPCILMRGGSSKGPYFRLSDLPPTREGRARFLLAAMGSPDLRQIDGIGGADPLTSKVAMVAPSERPDTDIDYHFAQVSIEKPFVDTGPSCGNMLAGVGPFGIETGMVRATGTETKVRIYEANTGSRIIATIRTRDGAVEYDGDAEIAGVPGRHAPIRLDFMDVAGAKTGSLLPSGAMRDEIDGIETTLIDVAMPIMVLRAADIGKTGHETRAELDADTAFFARIEAMRREAGRRMGMGDVTDSVMPKVAILAEPREGGHIAARYFVPHRTHAAMAVTGGICLATCAMLDGSVADGLAQRPAGDDRMIRVEHPSGLIEIALRTGGAGAATRVISGGVLRTARKLMAGEVFVPRAAWEG